MAGCSAAFPELGCEPCGREDREVGAKDEQVLVACDEVRATGDREREQVVVVGIA